MKKSLQKSDQNLLLFSWNLDSKPRQFLSFFCHYKRQFSNLIYFNFPREFLTKIEIGVYRKIQIGKQPKLKTPSLAKATKLSRKGVFEITSNITKV